MIFEMLYNCPHCSDQQSHEVELDEHVRGLGVIYLKGENENVECRECGKINKIYSKGTIDLEINGE